jgi:hypothetical protein
LADAPEQHDAIEKCMILNCKLGGYAGYASMVEQFAEAIVHSRKRWAAFLEALFGSKWLASRTPSAYLTRVTARIYSQVQPDTNGRDSRGFYHRAGPGGRIGDGDALCGFNRTPKRERTNRADPPIEDHELRFDYAPAGRATLHRREAPKSLSATDERHAHETAQLEGPSLMCPTVYHRGAKVVRTIKRRFGSPEQVEYETLVPTTDPRAALLPASTATQEDLDNAITISRAVHRAVPRNPETLVEFLYARYVLARDERRPPKLGKSVPHHKPRKISDTLMARVLGVDKKAVNARQSRLKYYRKAIAAELTGRSAPRERPTRFIPPWELMSKKMQTVINSGGTLAPRASWQGTGALNSALSAKRHLPSTYTSRGMVSGPET